MKKFPTRLDETLEFNGVTFQLNDWVGSVWVRGQHVAQTIEVKPQALTYKVYKNLARLDASATRVAKVRDIEMPKVGRRRGRQVRLFSLAGAALLADLIGTPKALEFSAWATAMDRRYGFENAPTNTE